MIISRSIRTIGVAAAMLALLALSAAAQQEGRAGGRYGRVFEASGGSPAAQALKSKLGIALRAAITRPAARPVQRRPTRPAVTPGRQARTTPVEPTTPPAAAAVTNFRPNPANDSMQTLANLMGTTEQEKLLYKQVFTASKIAFEAEVAKKGRKNNLSAALTFFIGSTVWVYHNSPEPSDAAVDNLWNALEGELENTPEMAQMSDADKQLLYDTLIALSGVVLFGYTQAKQTNNGDLLLQSQVLAGTLIQTVLKSDPEKLRFSATGLVSES